VNMTSPAELAARLRDTAGLLQDPVFLMSLSSSNKEAGRLLFSLVELVPRAEDAAAGGSFSAEEFSAVLDVVRAGDGDGWNVVVRPAGSEPASHHAEKSGGITGLAARLLHRDDPEDPAATNTLTIRLPDVTVPAAAATGESSSGVAEGKKEKDPDNPPHAASTAGAAEHRCRICVLGATDDLVRNVVGNLPELDERGVLNEKGEKEEKAKSATSRLSNVFPKGGGRAQPLGFTAAGKNSKKWIEQALLGAHDYACFVFAFTPDCTAKQLEKAAKEAKKGVVRLITLSLFIFRVVCFVCRTTNRRSFVGRKRHERRPTSTTRRTFRGCCSVPTARCDTR
jgi:hypothetical protein